jgi:nucleoside-diphosphate-sugar epimerase
VQNDQKEFSEIADRIIPSDAKILVTGAAGFIGSRVVECLLRLEYTNIRCLVRPTSKKDRLEEIRQSAKASCHMEIMEGNLLSPEECLRATKDVRVIYHLAAALGEKSIPDAFLNTVVATKNLLVAAGQHRSLKRFVTVSSFSVYSNQENPQKGLLDERCPLEKRPALRGDAYSFAKVKQEEIVQEYASRYQIPYVIVRPGAVYGQGNETITVRVGIGTFGVFLHLGGSNTIPLTYVENCAEAIVLAGLKTGVDGEVFNVVDDDLPSSRKFLAMYKAKVGSFFSLYLPKPISRALCLLWDRYSTWSQGQLPPTYGVRTWHAYWKKTRYTNEKLKSRLGWRPRIATKEGLNLFFESCRRKSQRA